MEAEDQNNEHEEDEPTNEKVKKDLEDDSQKSTEQAIYLKQFHIEFQNRINSLPINEEMQKFLKFEF